MPSPLFNALGGNTQADPIQDIMAQVNQFRANFWGDPKAEVQRLIQSGQITAAQYNQAAQVATQIMQKIGR